MQGLQQVTTWGTTTFNYWCSNIEWSQIQCDESLRMKGKTKNFSLQTQCDESLRMKVKAKNFSLQTQCDESLGMIVKTQRPWPQMQKKKTKL